MRKVNVLLMGDAAAEKGKEALFDCLFDALVEKVWQVGLADAAENYAETVEDWDVVIIHSDHADELLADILEMDPGQAVMVMKKKCISLVKQPYGFDLPENAEMVKKGLEYFTSLS